MWDFSNAITFFRRKQILGTTLLQGQVRNLMKSVLIDLEGDLLSFKN